MSLTPKQEVDRAPNSPIPDDEKERQKDYICSQISIGRTLREVCREPGMASFVAVYDWIAKDKEFALRFARARDIGADAIASDALEIMDAEPERDDKGKLDPAAVAWQKNRAELRLKLLAKWNPKLYGEKIQQDVISSDGSMTPKPTISVAELTDEQLAAIIGQPEN